MTQECYAKYITAYPIYKEQSAQLTSSNSIVGQNFTVKENTKKQTITLTNKFGFDVAVIDGAAAKEIILYINKGYIVFSFLVCVKYNYSAQQHCADFLFIAYPKKYENEFSCFLKILSDNLSRGNKPKINFDKFEIKKILDKQEKYRFSNYFWNKKTNNNTVIIKNKQLILEKFIEAGRNKNPWCYVFSILFLLVVIGSIGLLIYKLIF